MILITTHAVFDEKGVHRHGTGTELGNYFKNKNKNYIFIRHALYGEAKSQVDNFHKDKTTIKRLGFSGMVLPFRLIQDQIINLFFILKYRKKLDLYIGIDPLNAFTGIIAKRLKIIDKVIFYTADYAHRRFANKLVNNLYHILDGFVARNADQVWNVSSRIVNERIKQGLNPSKIYLVPNTPEFSKTKRLSLTKINKHDLVIVSNITNAINYMLLIKSVKKLKEKYSDIRLIVIGSGNYQKFLEKEVARLKLKKTVIFKGSKSHEEVLDILSRSAVGVAIYTLNNPWTEFGDSLKVREYLACGLPVIMNNVAATADDVKRYKAGIILDENAKGFEKAVEEIFNSAQKYNFYRKNAIKLARRFDFTKIVNQALANI